MPTANILASRAIAATFLRQLVLPLIMVGYGVAVLLVILLTWLVQQYSPWWIIFAVPLALLCIVLVIFSTIYWIITRRLAPEMTRYQRNLAKEFVEQLAGSSEFIGSSRLFIVYRVIKDLVRKRPKKYMADITQKPGDFKRIFARLRDSFIS